MSRRTFSRTHCILASFAIVLLCSTYYPAYAQNDSGAELTFLEMTTAAHFMTSDGESIVVEPGIYQVDLMGTSLQLLPDDDGLAMLIAVETLAHDEEMDEPIAAAYAGETAEEGDILEIALLLPDGTYLSAMGSISGVSSRGRKDRRKNRQAMMAQNRNNRLANREKMQQARADKGLLGSATENAGNRLDTFAANRENRQETRTENLTDIKESFQRFTKLSCAQKISAMDSALKSTISARKFGRAGEPPADGSLPARRIVIAEIVDNLVVEQPEFFANAMGLAETLRKRRDHDRIKRVLREGFCGTDPQRTQAEVERIVIELVRSFADNVAPSRSAGTSEADSVKPRGAPVADFLFTPGNILTPGGSVSLELAGSGSFGAAFNTALGIAVGRPGSSPCEMPRFSNNRLCVRNFSYYQIGVKPDAGIGVGLGIGLWAVNPRDLQGRYTTIGGSVSFELAALGCGVLATFTTAATAGATAVAAPACLAGATAVGVDVVFDHGISTYVECAVASRRNNVNTYLANCGERPKFLGVVVSGGLSLSVNPVEGHWQEGTEATFWWYGGADGNRGLYDVQGMPRAIRFLDNIGR